MATYYLNADTGSDAAAGGAGTPWLTISKFNTTAASGDTCILQRSVAEYSFATLEFPNKTLTFEAELAADGTLAAVIDGAGADRRWGFSFAAVPPTVTFKNMIFENIVKPIAGAHEYGIFANTDGSARAGTLVFENCIIRDCHIDAGSSTGGGLFGNFGGGSWGLRLTMRRCAIYNITKKAGSASAIVGLSRITFNSTYQVPAITLENCLIDLGNTGTSQVDRIFTNGTIAGCTLSITNTIINARGDSVDLRNTAFATESITYSDLYNLTSTPTLGTGSITSDPLLVDPANGNFNLRPTSPCLNTGTLL